jgi:arginine N-succinyltransferase
MGVPHPSGRAAMRMLEAEGFRNEGYIDIFDGGPTMSAPTDQVRTIRDAKSLTVDAVGEAEGGRRMLIAAGHLKHFAAVHGKVAMNGETRIDARSAQLLGIGAGDCAIAADR